MDNSQDYLFKCLVVGEIGVGKSSVIRRYAHGVFSMHYKATIGVDFALRVINWDDNTVVRMQLWDIAGQERFGNMTRVYYKEAVAAFVVFDVTRVGTFDAVAKWKADIDAKVQLPNGKPIPVVLLANKCDLAQKEGPVADSKQMDKYCEENGFVAWFETSAKDNINIDQAANFLVSQVMENDPRRPNKESGTVDVTAVPPAKSSGSSAEPAQSSCSC